MFIILGLFAGLVAAGALSPVSRRQTAGDPASILKCIDVSLSNPRWEITHLSFTTIDYRDGKRFGDIKFVAHNVAANTTTDCFAESIDLSGASSIWHKCKSVDTTFQFSLINYDLKLQGTWGCGGSPNSMVFTGNGTTDTSITRCDDYPYEARGWETICLMNDGIAAASLTSPVTAGPQQPAPPDAPPAKVARCAERSAFPSWKVEGFSYRPSTASLELSANVTNLSNDERLLCSIKVDKPTLGSTKHPELWLNCPKVASSVLPPSRILSTQLMFNGDHNLLGVKQTWTCADGVSGVDPDSYAGVGYLVMQPKCGSSGAGAITCNQAEATFKGYTETPAAPH